MKYGKYEIGVKRMKEIRIIVAGGRDFKDNDLLSDTIKGYLEDIGITNSSKQIKFVSGTAIGADVLGEQFAHTYGYDVIRFPADWNKFGKSAGYRRNAEMAKFASVDGNKGILIAFWDGKSKGTKHMIDLAKRYGLNVHVVNY